jgi:diketogulonate reductase-like aldo/keto reductase
MEAIMADEWNHIRSGPGAEASPGKMIHNQGVSNLQKEHMRAMTETAPNIPGSISQMEYQQRGQAAESVSVSKSVRKDLKD